MERRLEKMSAMLATTLLPTGLGAWALGHQADRPAVELLAMIAAAVGVVSLLTYIVTVLVHNTERRRWKDRLRSTLSTARRLRFRSPLRLAPAKDRDTSPPQPTPHAFESLEQLRSVHHEALIAMQYVAEALTLDAINLSASNSHISSLLGRLLQQYALPSFEASRFELVDRLSPSTIASNENLSAALEAFESAGHDYARIATYWIRIGLERHEGDFYSMPVYRGLHQRNESFRERLRVLRGRQDLGNVLAKHEFFRQSLPSPTHLKAKVDVYSLFDMLKSRQQMSSRQIVATTIVSRALVVRLQNESGRRLEVVARITVPSQSLQLYGVWLANGQHKIALDFGEHADLFLGYTWSMDDWRPEWYCVQDLQLDRDGRPSGVLIGAEGKLNLRLTADNLDETYTVSLRFNSPAKEELPTPHVDIRRTSQGSSHLFSQA